MYNTEKFTVVDLGYSAVIRDNDTNEEVFMQGNDYDLIDEETTKWAENNVPDEFVNNYLSNYFQ
jgi:hypothetical protein